MNMWNSWINATLGALVVVLIVLAVLLFAKRQERQDLLLLDVSEQHWQLYIDYREAQ